MKVLLSNDDGVHAEGLRALREGLTAVSNLMVVAPLEERSTTGHTLSLDRLLRVKEISQNIYGCSGYPADCVLLGIAHLSKGQRPSLVVSGINRGANLAQDQFYSGTIAAAREAALHDVPSIAVSLCCDYHDDWNDQSSIHYGTAAQFVNRLIALGIQEYIPAKTVLNINVPNLPRQEIKGVKLTTLGFRKYSEEIDERTDVRGRKYYWVAGQYQGHVELPDSDCQAVHEGYISVNFLDLLGGTHKGPQGVWDILTKGHEF